MGEVLRARKDVETVTLNADVGPFRVFDAMFECNQVLSSRYVAPTGRKGIYGSWARVQKELAEHFMHDHHAGDLFKRGRKAPKSFHLCGIEWSLDERIGPHLIAAWHPTAVIPPATVLRREGIVYCTLTQS